MPYEKLKSGDNLLLKVTEVKENVKTNIVMKNGTKNRHDVYMVDPKTKTEYKGEYLTVGAYDYAFHVGVLQYIQCKCDTVMGCEVTPGYVPAENNELEYLPRPKEMDRQRPDVTTQAPQQRIPNISGSPIAFGYAYAKDIVLEQIRAMSESDRSDLGSATLSKMIGDLGDALADRMIKKAIEPAK